MAKVKKNQRVFILVILTCLFLGASVGLVYNSWKKRLVTSSLLVYVNVEAQPSATTTDRFYARSQSKDITDSINALFTATEFLSKVERDHSHPLPPGWSVKKISPQIIRLSSESRSRQNVESDLKIFTSDALGQLSLVDNSLTQTNVKLVSDDPSVYSREDKLLVNLLAGVLGGAVLAGFIITLRSYL